MRINKNTLGFGYIDRIDDNWLSRCIEVRVFRLNWLEILRKIGIISKGYERNQCEFGSREGWCIINQVNIN